MYRKNTGRMGLFGGSFNPITNAHLQVAEKALIQADLDGVILIPAGYPYFKSQKDMASKEDRFAMCELATMFDPNIGVSAIELNRLGPSYTSETIAAFKSCCPTEEFFFIVGGDKLEEIPKWHDVESVYSNCSFIVIKRNEIAIPEEVKPHISFILDAVDGRDISSTGVRKRVNAHQPIKNLVPPSVLKYIKQHKLYTE